MNCTCLAPFALPPPHFHFRPFPSPADPYQECTLQQRAPCTDLGPPDALPRTHLDAPWACALAAPALSADLAPPPPQRTLSARSSSARSPPISSRQLVGASAASCSSSSGRSTLPLMARVRRSSVQACRGEREGVGSAPLSSCLSRSPAVQVTRRFLTLPAALMPSLPLPLPPYLCQPP